jgi:hypothetical protein
MERMNCAIGLAKRIDLGDMPRSSLEYSRHQPTYLADLAIVSILLLSLKPSVEDHHIPGKQKGKKPLDHQLGKSLCWRLEESMFMEQTTNPVFRK